MKIFGKKVNWFIGLFIITSIALIMDFAQSAFAAQPSTKTPVILDTDIGDDIDDTWALGLLLKSPELDVKLIVGDYGKPLYRTKIIAKFLETVGRTDIPIGMGIDTSVHGGGPQSDWVKDYNINKYPGKIYPDGVQAIIDTIMNSPEKVILVCIGPLPNIAAALEREPRIAEKARFVGMHGSVRKGYGGSKDISAEWNVKADVKACQKVFTAQWDMLITPLDTCGVVDLFGEQYKKVRDSGDKIARTIIENYKIWSAANKTPKAAQERSSTLFDTVAVYLAINTDLVKVETLGIRVDDKGFTVIDENAKKVQCATEWKDLNGFRDFLVNRLTGGNNLKQI
ncbi:MAG: nucleoside hydrolase [Verrucomicrobiia bacterium]